MRREKGALWIFAAACLMLLPFGDDASAASSASVNGVTYEYELNENEHYEQEATITGCTGSVSTLVIPEELDGYKVVAIESEAFEERSDLRAVFIADTVTLIGPYAFANCVNLAEVELSDNLATLGGCAFASCEKLTSIRIPKSLVDANIPVYTITGPFGGCSALKEVTFEDGIKQIAPCLFAGCTGLEHIAIPETVTKIGENAFSNCTNLQEIAVPDSVTEIGYSAFEACTSLASADMGNGVTSVGPYAFANCVKLAEVHLSIKLTVLSSGIFSSCISLESVEIPDGVVEIQSNAFYQSGLRSLELPGTVKSLGFYAFRECEKLSEIVISDSVTDIGEYAFGGCAMLSDVTLGSGLKTLGEYVFYNCDKLTEVRVPDSVTYLGACCFAECDQLSDVTLGTGITEIPAYAFDHCAALGSLILPYRVKTISENAFTNCIALERITIPRVTENIADNVFSYLKKITICGVEKTYAQEYADEKGIAFQPIDNPAQKVTLGAEKLVMDVFDEEVLTLAIEPADFTDEVFWKSSKPDVVAVDETGLLQARMAGTSTIKVTVGETVVSCEVTVAEPTTIQLSDTSCMMEALETRQLTATILPESEAGREVQWSSADENVAAVDDTGMVTARTKGTTTITARVIDEEKDISAACEVTVTNTGHLAGTVEDLESAHEYGVNMDDIWLYTSPDAPDAMEITFDEQTNVEDGFDYLYIYDGQGNEIGSYTGTALAGQTVTVPGDTLKIRLVSDEGGTAWGFKVTSIVPVDIEKEQQEITGSAAYTKVYGDAAFALDAVLAVGDGELSYESDNAEVAAVDQNGNVTVMGAGKADITITASETENYLAAQMTVAITVAKAEQELEITCESTMLYVGDTVKITALSTTGTVKFDSNNAEVASVTEDGTVTAKAAGSADITVRSIGDENYNDAQQVVTLTVCERAAASIDLASCTVTLAQDSFVYDGMAKEPEVTVSYGDKTLTRGVDYVVSYENNINPGEASVKVSALPESGYTGTVEITFTIRKEIAENATEVEAYAFSNCDTLYELRLRATITKIGDYAFSNCKNLASIYFYGNAPAIGTGAFENVTATAYYPAADSTWTLDRLAGYGGNLTWIPWDPASGMPAKRSLSLCTLQAADGGYVYDGTAKTPAITVTDGSKALTENVDYTVSYRNNIDAGTAAVQVNGAGMYAGTLSATFEIAKAEPVLQFAKASVSVTYGDGSFKNGLAVKTTDGAVSYTSDNTQTVTVDGNTGTVTVNGAGIATITAAAGEGKNYKAGSASCTVSVDKAENTITAKDITRVYSKNAQSMKIGASAGDKAALAYRSNNKSVKVSASGKVTIAKKFIGSAKIFISAKETANYEAAEDAITVTVNPKGVSLKKLRNDAGKKLTVTWKQNKDITGYEVQYSTNKKFASGVKKKTVKKYKTTSLKLSGLKKGKDYYVRIRTYKTVKGKKYYSAWSKAKSVKIRK